MKILYYPDYRPDGKTVPEIDLFVQHVVWIGETKPFYHCFIYEELLNRICGSNIPACHQLEGIGRKITGVHPFAERRKIGCLFGMVKIKTVPPVCIVSPRGIFQTYSLNAFDHSNTILHISHFSNT